MDDLRKAMDRHDKDKRIEKLEEWFHLIIDHIGPSDMSDEFEMRIANWCANALDGQTAPQLGSLRSCAALNETIGKEGCHDQRNDICNNDG